LTFYSTNDILDLEIEAGGTQFAADEEAQTAFSILFDGDRWMVFQNSVTKVLHWDFSVLGRFISFPVIDSQATGSLNINLTKVGVLGQQWGASSLSNFAQTLSTPAHNANAGKLRGNRIFYANDYMVHRGLNYVSTLKMTSSRTQNTECTNTQNPLGFHLSDGVLYTYLQGTEYEDIAAAWDFNIPPGITTDYGNTPLDCGHTQFTGVESFVGGVSDGQVGLAAMRYTNADTHAFHFQKAWFFLEDDVQHIMISNITSTSNASVLSVLDQRRHAGAVIIDGFDKRQELSASQTTIHPHVESLWHGNVGYSWNANDSITLSVQVGEKTGNWSTIGTSTQPPTTVDLFAAWFTHNSVNSPISYTAFPGTTPETFRNKKQSVAIETVRNDGHISAVLDPRHQTAMAVFWDVMGGSVEFPFCGKTTCGNIAAFTLSANANIAVMYNLKTGEVTVSDPSQTLIGVVITVQGAPLNRRKSLVFALPTGGLAGSSVSQNIRDA